MFSRAILQQKLFSEDSSNLEVLVSKIRICHPLFPVSHSFTTKYYLLNAQVPVISYYQKLMLSATEKRSITEDVTRANKLSWVTYSEPTTVKLLRSTSSAKISEVPRSTLQVNFILRTQFIRRWIGQEWMRLKKKWITRHDPSCPEIQRHWCHGRMKASLWSPSLRRREDHIP